MDRLNLIFIMLDSLRQDHVSFYNRGEPVFEGVPACKTPNIDKLARESVVFENVYPCGLPTIPVRIELMTGNFTLPYRGWEPLRPYPWEITIAEILAREGYVCGLVADTYHLFKPGMNFHRGFHSFIWIRGQEYDAYASHPPLKRRVKDYVKENYPEEWRRLVARYLANIDDVEKEEDYFPARVFRTAAEWLEKNVRHGKPLFLWIDCFDPHEPWDPPPRFDTYTDPNYRGPRLVLPMGGPADRWATEEDIRYIRGLYAGEVSFVDYCLGQFLEKVEELGLMDNSIIVLTSDHGHPLADHGKFLKGPDRLYNELLKVPFMIRLPGGEHARRVDAIAMFPDVLPTLLELMGLKREWCMQGRSFAKVVLGEKDEHRDAAIMGYHEAVDRCIRDKEWSLILRPEGQPDELYNLKEDPKETKNLIDERRDVAARLMSKFGTYFFREERRIIRGLQGRYELSEIRL